MTTATETDRPFVTVIVPALNASDVIGTCLAAALNQSYPADAFEVIVADNGSTDHTCRVVDGFTREAPGRVRLVVERTVRSSYAARNQALSSARGGIIAFTDADCVPSPVWLEHGVRALQAQGSGGVAGRVVFTFRRGIPNPLEYWDAASHLRQRYYVESLHFGATANLLIEAGVFRRVGLFRSDLVSGGDHEFGRRLRVAGERLTYCHDAVVMHPARATLAETFEKAARLGRAHASLHALGIFGSRRHCLSRFKPRFRYEPAPDWPVRLSPARRLGVLLAQNVHTWITCSICLAQAIAPGRQHAVAAGARTVARAGGGETAPPSRAPGGGAAADPDRFAQPDDARHDRQR
jgi:glycosyltransferase involved in cell wall biosynthesis